MEIYRREGEAFSSIRAAFDATGNLKIDGQDMGPLVEQFFGDDDFEYYLTIPKKELENFTLEVLKKTFNQTKPLSFYDLKDMCKDAGIKHHYDWWN